MTLKFIENKEFLRFLKEYKETKNENSEKYDLKKNRQVFNSLGEIFDNMAKKLLFSPKFINYTQDWKNEMYSEGVYNCIRYVDNFNVDTHDNPFAYFTQVIWNSFLQVLNKEKRIKMQKTIVMEKIWKDMCPNDELFEINKEKEE